MGEFDFRPIKGDTMLRWAEVNRLVRLSRNTVLKEERAGRFPPRHRLTDYANLSRIAFDGFGWWVELFIIDRYGEVRVCEPEDLWEFTIMVTEILEAAQWYEPESEDQEEAA